MADGVFNIGKGRVVEFYNRVESNDPATSALTIVLLKVAEADATLIDYDDLNALLLAAGNTEAAFTGYSRKELTDVELAALPAPDDTGDKYDIDLPDQTWSPTTTESIVKLLVCYDADTGTGTDANIIPLTHHDFTVTTDSDFTAVIDAAGFFSAG